MRFMNRPSIVALIGSLALVTTSVATAATPERDEAIARLESRADVLAQQRLMSPKPGQARLHGQQAQEDAVRAELQRLRAGGAVDHERLADLTGGAAHAVDSGDSAALVRQARERQEVLERRLSTGPKIGSLEREHARSDVEELDALIADLEGGRQVDADRVAGLIHAPVAREPMTAAERRHEGEVELATARRRLVAGPKLGSAERARLHEEIAQLEAMIDQLEGEQRR